MIESITDELSARAICPPLSIGPGPRTGRPPRGARPLPAYVRAQHVPHSVFDEADPVLAAVDAPLVRVPGPAPHPTAA